MVHHADTLKNELTGYEPPAFEDRTLEATDTLTIGKEPAMYQFFYLLWLDQSKNTTVNKISCSLAKKGRHCHILGC